MGYRLIGEATMVVHFLFLVFLAVGGFLAWRWPRLISAHLAVAAWGLLSLTTGVECPLTVVEDWARRNAGQRGLPSGGFIDHYIEGVVYPGEHTVLAHVVVLLLVLVSWSGYLRRRPIVLLSWSGCPRRRPRAGSPPAARQR
ncbi:hypothetical protein FHS43_004222 [Streptosporangium becharense]|uniref:DUF2784 domain-containing protein n=1 Tax=Streptosporangium becharense TaxID=1816182 RepID=A0A7W9MFE7_9ACTN|nr:DUF2784 domain-containing protein [Streptosporangium becharense]MBB2912927.1 hypothetical protein [Streptosporangium becharense]MBB5818248.1 hypothetical protein [Streptosporangium becharense]